ncbi:alpha-L-fucosidase [Pontiellaceae bacterium B12227]|nr:alpha-L-fucosidase [Pontiellaceae bacterium B12227]
MAEMDLQITAIAATDDPLLLPPEKIQWYRDAKIGLYIHWGLYSLTQDGEWTMFLNGIDVDEYAERADLFAGDHFDADELAELAVSLGARYSYFTTRHHDGFCLYDSAVSDFSSVKTGAKRDFVREYLDAFRAKGLEPALYYSPMDWRFPGYFFPHMYHKSALAMKQQGYAQVRELMSNYGVIPVLWYDGGWLAHGGLHFSMKTGWHGRKPGTPGDQGQWLWEPEKLNAMVREIQPDVLINPRSGWQGDFDTYEAGQLYKFIDGNKIQNDRPWEGCDALNAWWSHVPGIQEGRGTEHWIRTTSQVICRGGNMMINIGPMGDGSLDPEHTKIFHETGEWIRENGEAIYGTRGGPFEPGSWGGASCRGDQVFLHILEWPEDGLILPDLGNTFSSAKKLVDGSPVEWEQDQKGICLKKPEHIEPVVTVVVLK